MSDDHYTADDLYDRIMAATYNHPGDDVAQAAAAHRLAQDLAGHIAALEKRLATAEQAADLWMRKYEDEVDVTDALEFQWESKEPGTQGAILEAFYALVPEGHEYDSADPGPGHLLDRLAALEAVQGAVGEMLNAIEKAHEDDEWLDWPPLNEWNALLRAYNALAAVGQGETKNAPTDT